MNQIKEAVRLLATCCSALPLAACTIVNIEGPAKVSRVHLGLLRIAPAEGSTMVAYRTRGLGVVPGQNGATLGYASQTVVALTAEADCRVVLFEPDSQTVSNLASLLQGVVNEGQICSAGGAK